MKMTDKKRMIFSFYLEPHSFEHRINQLHLRLLEHYINRFDEVIFCIITDDLSNRELINKLTYKILNIYDGNITFKLYENTGYRESLVFYNEIALKMSDLDGLTFFAHNKGISDTDSPESIEEWVTAMYYFNFEYPLPLDLNGFMFYGALKCVDYSFNCAEAIYNKYKWMYCGTFYWGKYQEVQRTIKKYGIEIPILVNRWYSELFPGELVGQQNGLTLQFISMYYEPVIDGNIDWYLKTLYNGDNQFIYNDFMKIYNRFKTNE